MSARPVVLVTCRQMLLELREHRGRIEQAGFDVLPLALGGRQQFSSDELAGYTAGLVGIIAGDDELDRRFFERATDLRVVIRWGIGMDSVDHVAAAERGVIVRNTPGVFASEVADSAMGYLLDVARRFSAVDRLVRGGDWPKLEGVSLGGKRAGIVGFGAIGRQIARRARGFDMEVVAYDPFATPDNDVPCVTLNELLSTSDFVLIACPLTTDTHHLFNASTLGMMKSSSYLINVARGPVVDEEALAVALSQGVIAGAGLDVFESEPLPVDSPLRHLSNVTLGAHNASNTREGVVRASATAVNFLLEELTR